MVLALFASVFAAPVDLDTTFGSNGKVKTWIGSRCYNVAVQSDGKILAAGGNFVARYTVTGTLKANFGTDGKATTDFSSIHRHALMGRTMEKRREIK